MSLKEYQLNREVDELDYKSTKSKVIITGEVSEWAKARHWLLTKNHALTFLRSMKEQFKEKIPYDEKQKEGIINCYRSRSDVRRIGMFKHKGS